MSLDRLNYHHLRYFWAVARDGNLTRVARALRVSASALSAQIRQLEDDLGEPLFVRAGRRLELTEAGRLALGYADDIFAAGGELRSTLRRGRGREEVLRVGAVATLSRNFQRSFVAPLLAEPALRLRLEAGGLDGLLARLQAHDLDLVLANRPAPAGAARHLRSRVVARQPVSLVGPPRRRRFRVPDDLDGAPLIVPGPDSEVRAAFDALCAQRGLRPRLVAEVDDMATMRLLARDARAITLVPTVVVRDELRAKVLRDHGEVPGLFEAFYAITAQRRFQHPLVGALLGRDEGELLAAPPPA